MQFSPDQQYALQVLCGTRMHAAVFGGAGTGKSTVLREFRRQLDARFERYVIVAPTGVAALNVGGETAHKVFGLPVRPGPMFLQYGCRRKRFKGQPGKPLSDLTIIIEEVSMIRADVLDAMDVSLREDKDDAPFGGARVVFFGDPLQLAPIVNDDDRRLRELLAERYGGSPWFFSSRVFERLMPEPLLLEVSHRQQDPRFYQVLSSLRYGDASGLDYINQWSHRRTPGTPPRGVLIGTHRAQVQRMNETCLEQLPYPEMRYAAEFKGRKPDALPVDAELRLRLGAQVLCAANIYSYMLEPEEVDYGPENPQGVLLAANGSRGEVVCLEPLWVRFETGVVIRMKQYTWEFQGFDEARGTFTVSGEMRQIPLLLGWAITSHKSQGMSLSEIEIDMRHMFDAGQTYVALSRVFSLYGLTLKHPLRPKHFKANKNAVTFMHNFTAWARRARGAA